MKRTRRTRRSERAGRAVRRRGFTLIELLTVMGIITLLLAIGVPSVTALMNSGRLSNARQSVVSGVSVARAIAVRGGVPEGDGDFAGAAAVMMPEPTAAGGELTGTTIQVVRHDRFNGQNPVYEPAPNASILSLPGGAAAVGIFRDAGGMRLIAPPFVVRFNREGTLITTASDETGSQAVRFDVYDDGTPNTLRGAIGVIVFELEDLNDAGYSIDVGEQLATGDDTAGAWVRDNGRHLLFNRYSGTVLNQ